MRDEDWYEEKPTKNVLIVMKIKTSVGMVLVNTASKPSATI